MADLLGGFIGKIGTSVKTLYKGSVGGATSGFLSGLGAQLPLAGLLGSGSVGGISDAAVQEEIDGLYVPDAVYLATIHCEEANGGPVDVSGYINTFPSLEAGSTYAAPFDNFITKILGEDVENVLNAVGVKTVTKALTSKIWTGTEHLTMSVDILLVAEKNVTTEITEKKKALLRLVLPSDEKGFLTSPGPALVYSGPGIDEVLTTGKDLLANVGAVVLSPVKPTDPPPTTGSGSATGQVQAGGVLTAIQPAVDLVGKVNFGQSKTISITLGKYLAFESVVVERVSFKPEQIIGEEGKPMIEVATIQFTTFRVPTIEDIDKLLAINNGGSSGGKYVGARGLGSGARPISPSALSPPNSEDGP